LGDEKTIVYASWGRTERKEWDDRSEKLAAYSGTTTIDSRRKEVEYRTREERRCGQADYLPRYGVWLSKGVDGTVRLETKQPADKQYLAFLVAAPLPKAHCRNQPACYTLEMKFPNLSSPILYLPVATER